MWICYKLDLNEENEENFAQNGIFKLAVLDIFQICVFNTHIKKYKGLVIFWIKIELLAI